MRRRSFTALPLLFALLLAPMPPALPAEASYGMHGMVLFGGRDGLYASHLPMFHAPHDVQVVLKVRFADAALDRAMRARLDGRTALWTLAPERFALERLAPDAARPLAGFAADVVEGHFEQGGTARYRHAQLTVEQVVLYRPLDAAPSVRTASRYVPVGRYLVKLIDSRPDFDHIVMLKRAAAGPVTIARQGVQADLRALALQVPLAGSVHYCAEDLL